MKCAFVQFLMLLACSLLTTAVTAQKRMCDQEVTCISPEGMVLNGNQLPLKFKLTNHGPDMLFNSDTVLYSLFVVQDQDTTVLYRGLTWGKGNNTVGIGESRMFEDGRKITFQSNSIQSDS